MKIILALSGGIDSMYMANRASELFPEASFAIAHCNFHLRGEESDGDELFVRSWAEKAGISCYVRHFDTVSLVAEKRISVEMAARELRYAWFEELALELGAEAVAVAHNANDNAETLVLNLLRGTGSKGLRGMSESRMIGNSGIKVLRPLLGISRNEIHSYMITNGLAWREDRTNGENFCDRNVVRNEIFPLFSKINPSFVRTLNEDIARFSQLDDIANDYFLSTRAAVVGAGGDILVEKLLGVKHWEFVLWRLLEASGITSNQFYDLVNCLKSGRQFAGKRFGPVLGASGRLVVSAGAGDGFGDGVCVGTGFGDGFKAGGSAGHSDGFGDSVRRSVGCGTGFGDSTGYGAGRSDGVRAGVGTGTGRGAGFWAGSNIMGASVADVRFEILERSEVSSLKAGYGQIFFDADKLPLPLNVRKWRHGDWLVPFGMRGRKKVSDLLTQAHYSLDEKAQALVIEYPGDSGSRVAALLFSRIDDSLKVSPSTVRVLRVYLED